jgi:all-trans-nonaprenyl-diphosphate synthase
MLLRSAAVRLSARRVGLANLRAFSTTISPVANDADRKPAISITMGEAPPSSLADPFALMSDQLRPLDDSLRDLVGSDHPVLTRVAQHFFELAGKRFRPTLVLLASSAAVGGAEPNTKQKRLAEIAEMIHAASLLHDDVIDLADTRRGARAAHRIYGNKVAVLAGDFLLARASVLLSRLGNVRVVELLATVIEEMVQGELMQVKALPHELLEFDHYLSKTYRKTAALMSLSCQASALLADHPPQVESALEAYGRHLGIAYQVVDDLLDFTGTSDALGKPALSDMEQGLATAPTLFAAEEFPEIVEIVQRRFADEGDVKMVEELVHRSDALRRTRDLATSHARQAADALGVLEPSASRDALLRLCFDVLNRQA